MLNDLINIQPDHNDSQEEVKLDDDDDDEKIEISMSLTPAGVPLLIPRTCRHNTVAVADSVQTLASEITDDRRCKGCRVTIADVANFPCGHVCECSDCPNHTCRQCGRNVDEKVKIYLS